MFYPEFYQIHKSLTIVLSSSGIQSLHEIVQPSQLYNIPRILALATLNAQSPDDSPKSFFEQRSTILPKDFLFNWFVRGTEGSQIDFLFMRQSFASFFACFAFFQFGFQSRLPSLPSVLLFEDRRKLCIPHFLSKERMVPILPLTDQFRSFFPDFLIRGTMATTWLTLATVLAQNREVVKVFLHATLGGDQRKMGDKFLMRSCTLATNVEPDAHGVNGCFAFELFEHLIQTSNNVLHAIPAGFAWI
jgi:hypothetical protein